MIPRSFSRRLLGFALLTLLALAGNYFQFRLFLGVNFLFGGIFLLLLIACYGPFAGAAAAALAGSIFLLQGESFNWFILLLEALAVGLLHHRRKFQLLTAAGVFWLLAGIPFLALWHLGIMAAEPAPTLLLSLHRGANSILNALTASLLLALLPIRSWLGIREPTEPPGLYDLLFHLILALVLIPSTVFMVLNSRALVSSFEERLHRELQAAATDTSYHLYNRLQLHLHGVQTLAEIGGKMEITPSRTLQRLTGLVARSFPDFRTMYVADPNGITVAFYPPENERGESNIGLDFSDRDYYHQLRATRLPVISDVFLGRGGVFEPIITMSVPIMSNRRLTGFASGALNLDDITRLLQSYADSKELEIIVLDRQQQVLASTLAILPLMSRFTPEKLKTHLGGGLRIVSEAPSTQRPQRHDYLVLESRIAPDLPWTLIVSKPVLPLQETLTVIYIRHLLLMLFLAGVATLLAWLLSRALSRSISQLGMITSDLPAQLLEGGLSPLPWPQAKTREMQVVVNNFQSLLATLQHNFREMQEHARELSRLNQELREEHLYRQKLQETVQRQKKMEAIGNLAAGVAHDLNNILSSLVGYPDLLLHELPPDSALRPKVLRIRDSGERAAAVVQDLLTLARRAVVQKQVLNLNQVVASYLESPNSRSLVLHQPRLRIRAELDPELRNVSGSEVHLAKSLMNLVINAAEAMPDGGEIVIATANRRLDAPLLVFETIPAGEYAVLSVRDNGIGIPAEDRHRIFEPFYTKKVMGRSGTGLGMSVVWTAVKDHDGFIDLQSEKGKGTRVELYLPVVHSPLPERREKVPLARYAGSETVVVVDDIETQREMAAHMLRKLGYSVYTASTGEEAVEAVRSREVDLVLLDMLLEPGPDGLESYRRIIAVKPGQKAVLTSGYAETDRVREAQRLGAGPYVAKPFTLEKLGMAVRAELDRR